MGLAGLMRGERHLLSTYWGPCAYMLASVNLQLHTPEQALLRLTIHTPSQGSQPETLKRQDSRLFSHFTEEETEGPRRQQRPHGKYLCALASRTQGRHG